MASAAARGSAGVAGCGAVAPPLWSLSDAVAPGFAAFAALRFPSADCAPLAVGLQAASAPAATVVAAALRRKARRVAMEVNSAWALSGRTTLSDMDDCSGLGYWVVVKLRAS